MAMRAKAERVRCVTNSRFNMTSSPAAATSCPSRNECYPQGCARVINTLPPPSQRIPFGTLCKRVCAFCTDSREAVSPDISNRSAERRGQHHRGLLLGFSWCRSEFGASLFQFLFVTQNSKIACVIQSFCIVSGSCVLCDLAFRSSCGKMQDH